MQGFQNFIKFNSISDETLQLAAHYLEYKSIKKGEYLFKQGELNENFYGIVEGLISLRIRIPRRQNHPPNTSVTNFLKREETETFSENNDDSILNEEMNTSDLYLNDTLLNFQTRKFKETQLKTYSNLNISNTFISQDTISKIKKII
jgi:hypothetical protein